MVLTARGVLHSIMTSPGLLRPMSIHSNANVSVNYPASDCLNVSERKLRKGYLKNVPVSLRSNLYGLIIIF